MHDESSESISCFLSSGIWGNDLFCRRKWKRISERV